MEAALLRHPDEQAAQFLTQARAALTRPPIAAAQRWSNPSASATSSVSRRGVAPPEAQAKLEAEIRTAIAAHAAEAADALRRATERLVSLGWAGAEDGLAGARP